MENAVEMKAGAEWQLEVVTLVAAAITSHCN
jgi:hypothetical protein